MQSEPLTAAPCGAQVPPHKVYHSWAASERYATPELVPASTSAGDLDGMPGPRRPLEVCEAAARSWPARAVTRSCALRLNARAHAEASCALAAMPSDARLLIRRSASPYAQIPPHKVYTSDDAVRTKLSASVRNCCSPGAPQGLFSRLYAFLGGSTELPNVHMRRSMSSRIAVETQQAHDAEQEER
jgi:hypothetical protein